MITAVSPPKLTVPPPEVDAPPGPAVGAVRNVVSHRQRGIFEATSLVGGFGHNMAWDTPVLHAFAPSEWSPSMTRKNV